MASPPPPEYPVVRTVGLTGILVTFAERLSEPANRAAIAFRAALDRAGWDGVEETSTSLASAFLRFDPLAVPHPVMQAQVQRLLDERDWTEEALPEGRRYWRVPTVWGGELAPQLEEAAAVAGVSPEEAVRQLSAARVRVLTIGFAPGQPYLGELPEVWNLPRQQDLTPRVPEGALVLAIRQFVLFSAPNSTGWRHVGQTALRLFRPESDTPFALRAGDEVSFVPVDRERLEAIRARDDSGNGGAEVEAI